MATTSNVERRIAELSVDDPQCRNALSLDTVNEAIQRPGSTLQDVVSAVLEGYADRPALGERARERVTDPATGRTSLRLLPRFDTITYRQLSDRVEAVAADWAGHADAPLATGDVVAVLGFTSCDYATVDLACVRLGAVSVPLQSSASAHNLAPIVAESEPSILATSSELLDKAVALAAGSSTVRRVVVFDHRPEVDDQRERFDAAREQLGSITLESLAEVIARGATLAPAPRPTADDDRLALLIYTSGSTGTPKGAMYPGRLISNLWRGFFKREVALPAIGVNYMPMSHMAGRSSLYGTLAAGGTGYFTAATDLSTLFDDIALVRPTELMLVPRICDMLFQRYQSGLDRADDAAVKADLRENVLGGRLLWAACGTAPLAREMRAFVESCLDMPLHDGYGSTEAGGVLIDNTIIRPTVIDYKLVDVPELGYFGTDHPYPRGELLIRTTTIVPGYYKRPEATAEVFDADGYYRTGDVMAEIGPDRLVYVDRRKNVLKLSQGEFVAVSKLEALFVTSPVIRQIYVYGSSERSYLLAVVVPTEETQRGGDVAAQVSESLATIGKEAGLESYEIPREFLLETEPFSTGNGLLSEVRKLLRPRLKEHYGERLEQLYTDLAESGTSALRELRRTGRDQPVYDTVVRAAQAVLGCPPGALGADAHFTDLGGDSLSALSYSDLLEEIFGVEVPVGLVVSPATDLGRVAEHIETALTGGSLRPTVATVHGEGATQARAADLTLDRFIDAATLERATTLPRVTGEPHTVLLTGATGYLGRFLCLDWLERLAMTGGTLICIVRGSDAAAARERLDAAFDSGDAELMTHYRTLAAGHLQVLAGDIGDPDLGLDGPTWQRLADTVDLIVDPAALVNHVLPYDQLFGPNVVGTAELIRLAVTSRIKPFTYLSTVAMIGSEVSSPDEDSDIRVTSPVRALGDGYANGYATSKWAGEVLLREAHDLCGLPVSAFRSDMILAHSHYTGQLNVPDMFTRLLLSLIVTGIAPMSFYAPSTRSPHYDGIPVDFTAAAIDTIAAQMTGDHADDGYRTFNVLNPHDDGISLDVFVDWLAAAGHPIAMIDDYDEWFTRFSTALRGLPEKQKQHSLLPLLHAFARPEVVHEGEPVPTKRFRSAVQEAGIGADRDIPHIDAALIRKYASDLKALKLI